MIEMDEKKFEQILSASSDHTSQAKLAVFFYTPFCGTCHLAERMLSVVEQMRADWSLYKININFSPGLVASWRIESVPCLAFISQGDLVRKEYAFQSVDMLLEWFRAFFRNG